jgi:hypothetical protein
VLVKRIYMEVEKRATILVVDDVEMNIKPA